MSCDDAGTNDVQRFEVFTGINPHTWLTATLTSLANGQAAPADKAVVDRLVRAVGGRRITPAQPVPDHEDDAADDPAVIDPRNGMRQWEIWLDPAHLRLAQHLNFRQHRRLPSVAIESSHRRQRKQFNGF
jgi:hypothetical protein